jgi:hypothetical protein
VDSYQCSLMKPGQDAGGVAASQDAFWAAAQRIGLSYRLYSSTADDGALRRCYEARLLMDIEAT